jgi:hypothetical protein
MILRIRVNKVKKVILSYFRNGIDPSMPKVAKEELRRIGKLYRYVYTKEQRRKIAAKLVNIAIREVFQEKTGKRWADV